MPNLSQLIPEFYEMVNAVLYVFLPAELANVWSNFLC